MSGGTISGNYAATGGGVWVAPGSTFSKSGGGIIYGDTDATHTSGSTENTATGASSGNGHAVFYDKDVTNKYYRDADLGAGNNISTESSKLPALSGSANGAYNWIKQ
jgi:hypothetical protein